MTYPSTIRSAQTMLVFMLGCYILLIFFTNVTDYNVNFTFMEKVSGMSDTYSEHNRWRSISNIYLIHFLYWIVIGIEGLSGFFCMSGAWRLWKHRKAGSGDFAQHKTHAFLGVFIGLMLWLGAFLTVGGEWFLMWQSDEWNAQGTAFHLAELYGIALLMLMKD
jgi:predicted small integral membrane protein